MNSIPKRISANRSILTEPHLIRRQFRRVALAIEQDVSANPVHMGLLGADAVVFEAANLPNLIQEFGLASQRARL